MFPNCNNLCLQSLLGTHNLCLEPDRLFETTLLDHKTMDKENIASCLAKAHISMVKASKKVIKDHTRCVAYNYHGLDIDWEPETFQFTLPIVQTTTTSPLVPDGSFKLIIMNLTI